MCSWSGKPGPGLGVRFQGARSRHGDEPYEPAAYEGGLPVAGTQHGLPLVL